MQLIYCAGGNRRFDDIAIAAGYQLGARLPKQTYHEIYFADLDWRNPDRTSYMAELARRRPVMATVLDLEYSDQLADVLSWADEAAQYVQQVVVVPKVSGIIERLPRRMDGAELILGYSVPTRYGGTFVPSWEFIDWPVHLLGGSPHRQMALAHSLHVVSADGNMINLMATRRCQFWHRNAAYAKDHHWPTLQEADGGRQGDAPYEAFRRSCVNIVEAWHILGE